ncbi:hypothetical protein ACOSP7_031087 [Xanthoceras sorbifolium]
MYLHQLGLLCLRLLEGRATIQDFVPDSIVSVADNKTKSDSEAMRKYYQFIEEQTTDKNKTQSQSTEWSLDCFFYFYR